MYKYFFIILYFLIFLLILTFERKIFNSHISPLTFFCLLWCIVGIGANMALYDYYEPSVFINMIIITSIIIVFIFVLIIRKKINFNKLGDMVISFKMNLLFLIILEILFILLSIPKFLNAYTIFITYGMDILRGADVIGVGKDVGIFNILVEIVVKPGFYCIDLIAILSIFNDFKKKDKIVLWIINIFNIIYFTIMTAGRAFLVNSLFYFIITVVIFKRKRILFFLKKEKSKLIVFLGLIFYLLIMQNLRSPDISLLKTFYTYYFSGPIYMSKLLDLNKSIFMINSDYLYGIATFGFVSSFVSYFLIFLTGISQGASYFISSKLTNYNVQIGAKSFINSMCTSNYIFLLDWGYIGIIIGPLIISIISYCIYKKAIVRPNLCSMCILIFFINILIRTIFKWDLLYTDICMIYFYLKLFILFSKVRIKW